jgi:hypothetical protein
VPRRALSENSSMVVGLLGLQSAGMNAVDFDAWGRTVGFELTSVGGRGGGKGPPLLNRQIRKHFGNYLRGRFGGPVKHFVEET